MKKLFPLVMLLLLTGYVSAQTPAPVPIIQPYGKIDTADLRMTSCSFEPDANAEILFDSGVTDFGPDLSLQHHIRIKIYNDFGTKNANIRLLYHSQFLEGKSIGGLEAETINLEDNKIVITPLDKKQTYTEKINKFFSAIVFTFPNVKAGSIIEYKFNSYPQQVWFFQGNLPTRYSQIEIDTHKLNFLNAMKATVHTRQPLAVNTTDDKHHKQTMAVANVHSLPDEPYMTAREVNLQRVEYSKAGLFFSSWASISSQLVQYKGFGSKINENLTGEEAIFKKTDALKNDDERIAFVFDTVKNCMKWDKNTFFVSSQDIQSAWDKKTGNSAEINLVIYHLLKDIGIKAYPMVVCTRDHGKITPDNPDLYSLNNTVVYVPVDSTKFYILDASNKFNLYNSIPYNILNSYGLRIDISDTKYKLLRISDNSPVIQTVFTNAEIKPDGKMTGNAEIVGDSYNKTNALKKYDADGEEKYIDSTYKKNNSIKITSFKIENMRVDTLPLSQKIAFDIDLPGSGDGYIYFNTNLFTSLEDNPFKREERFSDIDLGFRNNYSINGVYKIPAGYKVESLPKNITLIMPDQSIVFKRTIALDDGTISVRYFIDHRKTVYAMDQYQEIRGYYKQMYELLNEQIVLKKQ